ncbi:hypothetical protein ACWC2M_22855 [Streptomyces sp. NPDC001761]
MRAPPLPAPAATPAFRPPARPRSRTPGCNSTRIAREDLADDERGPVKVAEWERIMQLLAASGGVYA